LDDKEIIILFAHSTREVVVLQPDAGVGFTVVLDDVAWRSKMARETSVTHDTSKRLWARPFRTEVASFVIIMVPMAWVSHALLGLCIVVAWAVPSVYLRF
jgi:hypothetical protein